MAIIKPFTFRAGEKARAAEVNQDFDILYQEVNNQSSEIQSLEDDITSIENSKANINGNSSQRFAVADAVGAYDAINKHTVDEIKETLTNKINEAEGKIPSMSSILYNAMPDYSKIIYVGLPSSYRVSSPCMYNVTTQGGTTIKVNGVTVGRTQWSDTGGNTWNTITVLLNTNDTLTCSGMFVDGGYIIPLKGV